MKQKSHKPNTSQTHVALDLLVRHKIITEPMKRAAIKYAEICHLNPIQGPRMRLSR